MPPEPEPEVLLDPPELRAIEPDPGALAVSRPCPGVACIRVPLPYPVVPSVNVYLLELDSGPVLVDCGTSLGLGWSAIETGLGRLGVEPAALAALVLTHTHSDHAGLAAEVVERSGCRLLRGAGPDSVLDQLRDAGLPLASRRELAAAEGVPGGRLPEYVGPVIAGDGRHVRAVPDRLLADGEELPGAAGWQVLAAAGHSPNQICLYRERDGAMISADLVLPVVPPFLEWGSAPDPASAHRRSLEAARALAPRLLLPGHGGPLEDADAAIAAALAGLDELLELTEAALVPGPASGYEVALRLAPGKRGLDRRQSLISIALAALEHLALVGLAEVVTGADGVRRFARAAGH